MEDEKHTKEASLLVIERASSGVRIVSVKGKIEKVYDDYLFINNFAVRKSDIVRWEYT